MEKLLETLPALEIIATNLQNSGDFWTMILGHPMIPQLSRLLTQHRERQISEMSELN